MLPTGYDAKKYQGQILSSMDGDADRVVFYYVDKSLGFHLVDGDKITSVIASFIAPLLQDTGLDLQLGICQTAYANGASTVYMQETLKIDPVFANTGVKHLHREAEKYDIGVYFEANGHGTILFSDKAIEALNAKTQAEDTTDKALVATNVLLGLNDLLRKAIGDALADILVVRLALAYLGWTMEKWDSI